MEADDCQAPPPASDAEETVEADHPPADQSSQQAQAEEEEIAEEYTPPTSNEGRTSEESGDSPREAAEQRGDHSDGKGDDPGGASPLQMEDGDHKELVKSAEDGGGIHECMSGKSSSEAEEVEIEEILEEEEEEGEEQKNEGEDLPVMDLQSGKTPQAGGGPSTPDAGGQPPREDLDSSLQEYAAALANMEEQDRSPESTPRTKISGVMSDAGESSPSNALDTGREFEELSNDPDMKGECSDAARQVVQEVLTKALMLASDSDQDSDTGLGTLAPSHSSPSETRPPNTGTRDGEREGELIYSAAKYGDGGDLRPSSPRGAVVRDTEDEEKTDAQKDQREPEAPPSGDAKPSEDARRAGDAEMGERLQSQERGNEEEEEDHSFGGDGNDEDDSEAATSQASPHPEYPMNYGNYKVCRRVSPGVKECLILETGEHIKYDKTKGRLVLQQSEASASSQENANSQARKSFKVARQMTEQGYVHLRLFRNPELREAEEPEGQAGDVPRAGGDARPEDMLRGAGTRPESGPGGRECRVAWETVRPDERQTTTGSEQGEEEAPGRNFSAEQDNGEEEEEAAVRDEIDRLLRQEGFSGLSATSQRLLAEVARSPKRCPPQCPLRSDVSPTAMDRYNAGYRSVTSADGIGSPGGWARGLPQSRPGANSSAMEADVTNMEGSYLGERQSTPRSSRAERSPYAPPDLFESAAVASPPAPGAVPNYRSLQEQQVSWMSMFRMLEEQHRQELQSQYSEHSRMIQEIQEQMERQLSHRQTSFSRRLAQHKDFLTESEGSLPSRGADRSFAFSSPSYPPQAGHLSLPPRDVRGNALHTSHLDAYDYGAMGDSFGRAAPLGDEGRQDGRPQPSGRSHPNPPSQVQSALVDYSTEDSQDADTEDDRERKLKTRMKRVPAPSRSTPSRAAEDAVRRVFEDSDEEPSSLPVLDPLLSSSDSAVLAARRQAAMRSPGDRGLSQSLLGDKLLRGGVYSSPMPLSRPRQRSKAGRESLEDRNSSALGGSGDMRRREHNVSRQLDMDMDTMNDSQLSARSRSLREEHSRHLSELRSYYEQQVQELRTQLGSSFTARESATEKIVREENKELRRKCSDLADHLEDAKSSIRSLEQKVQGLEVRAADYAERYETAERRLRVLEKQVVDGEEKLREQETYLSELSAKCKQQSLALQEAYKVQNGLEESSRRDRTNFQRVLEKYEILEKEHSIVKESYDVTEKKLFETRNQIVDLNKIIASYELLNKQLNRENENLQNRLAISINSRKGARTSYEESYAGERSEDNRSAYVNGSISARYAQAGNRDHIGELLTSLDADVSAAEVGRPSPLLTAEREMLRLQAEGQSNSQLLRAHKKFYGSEPAIVSQGEGGRTPPKTRGTPSPKSKAAGKPSRRLEPAQSGTVVENGGTAGKRFNQLSQDSPSAVRFDIDHRPSKKEENSSSQSGGVDVDRTLERIRAGEVVSRPQWEDVYTSLAKPSREPELPATQGMSREEKIKERLRAINEMEHRYDDLSAERRKLESCLNKIPISGRVDRKAKKDKEELETRLDRVDKELGSIRMSLKRHQVLKSSR